VSAGLSAGKIFRNSAKDVVREDGIKSLGEERRPKGPTKSRMVGKRKHLDDDESTLEETTQWQSSTGSVQVERESNLLVRITYWRKGQGKREVKKNCVHLQGNKF